MWPWGHLAVGYLCYVALVVVRDEYEQTLLTLVAVSVGTQFPDLVDKPLAWTLPLLPSGRSLAHSLVTATLVVAVVYWLGERVDREAGAVAFGIGYLSHSLVDLGPSVAGGLLRGDLGQLEWATYLLWPLLEAPPYERDHSFIEHFAAFEFDAYAVAQFALFGLAVAVWFATGSPGVREARRNVRRRLRHRAWR